MFLLKRLFITLTTLAFLWGAGLVWFIVKIPTSPVKDDAKTDAIIVLTGGSLRLEHGLQLLIAGKAPLLFISGVEENVTLPELLHGKETSAVAVQVPPERVELGHNAHSTIQNAEETLHWAGKHGITSLRVVTGNYHIPRSVFVLREAMPGVSIIADPVFPAEFSTGHWWLSQSSLLLVLSEYHKYIVTRLVYMLGIMAND